MFGVHFEEYTVSNEVCCPPFGVREPVVSFPNVPRFVMPAPTSGRSIPSPQHAMVPWYRKTCVVRCFVLVSQLPNYYDTPPITNCTTNQNVAATTGCRFIRPPWLFEVGITLRRTRTERTLKHIGAPSTQGKATFNKKFGTRLLAIRKKVHECP